MIFSSPMAIVSNFSKSLISSLTWYLPTLLISSPMVEYRCRAVKSYAWIKGIGTKVSRKRIWWHSIWNGYACVVTNWKIILSTCLGAKNDAYKHEQETRGVVHCDDASKIKYRVRNGYITPYVEIRVPKEALKKIVVGPTNNKMLTVQSIYHFLQINGYDINKIDVVSSKIPYRG